MGVIFALSAQPDPLPFLPAGLFTYDKLLHACEYAVLGFLSCRALLAGGLAPTRALLVALALASLYGASDEIHQLYVPNRTCDVKDWVADTAGAALGVALAAFLRLRGARASIRP
jgi:VanZ family protein